MKLPKRPKSHIIEAESWKLLQSLAPKEWIVREVTERDYGIDCYIELCSKQSEITGNLISVQLKGTNNIQWRGSSKTENSRSPFIKTETAFYWLNLPVPVFLFVADLSTKNIYYESVENQIRSNYGKLLKQKNMSFLLDKSLNLRSELGLAVLPVLYFRERLHNKFVFHMTNLLSNVDSFCDFIIVNEQRDPFLEVDFDRQLQFRALYESCFLATVYLGIDWPIESLDDLYNKDKKEWNGSIIDFHESTLGYAIQKIKKIFPLIIENALNVVCEIEDDYWVNKNTVFFNLCSNGDFDRSLDKLKN